MNTHDIQGLPIKQYDAPDGFTEEVMKKIHAKEPKKSSSNRYMQRSGLILIAASLIALFIGLTPIMDVLENTIYNADMANRNSGLVNITENIENITEKMSSLLTRPVDFISQAINKEE